MTLANRRKRLTDIKPKCGDVVYRRLTRLKEAEEQNNMLVWRAKIHKTSSNYNRGPSLYHPDSCPHYYSTFSKQSCYNISSADMLGTSHIFLYRYVFCGYPKWLPTCRSSVLTPVIRSKSIHRNEGDLKVTELLRNQEHAELEREVPGPCTAIPGGETGRKLMELTTPETQKIFYLVLWAIISVLWLRWHV
jgi:hypothetical protein